MWPIWGSVSVPSGRLGSGRDPGLRHRERGGRCEVDTAEARFGRVRADADGRCPYAEDSLEDLTSRPTSIRAHQVLLEHGFRGSGALDTGRAPQPGACVMVMVDRDQRVSSRRTTREICHQRPRGAVAECDLKHLRSRGRAPTARRIPPRPRLAVWVHHVCSLPLTRSRLHPARRDCWPEAPDGNLGSVPRVQRRDWSRVGSSGWWQFEEKTARPRAAPNHCEVFTSPAARPALSGGTPALAAWSPCTRQPTT